MTEQIPLPDPPRRTNRLRVTAAVAVIAGVLGSSSIASAATGPAVPAPSLLRTVGGLLGGVVGTVTNVTRALGINLAWGNEFDALNTAKPVTRAQVADAIGANTLASSGITGAGVDVAVIDTGIAPVAGLAGAVVNGPDLSLDQQVGLPAGIDGFGHGTHLAGIVAGRDGGIAPGARLVNLKVGAADGAVDVSQVIAGIDWVVAHRNDSGMNIRVITLAYGTDSTQAYASSPLTHAVESAWRNGIVVVVSAGNTGGALINPATDPFALTVGALDLNEPTLPTDDTLAKYSATASSVRGVDVLAPGTSILSSRVPGSTVDTRFPASRSSDGRFTKGSGTSQAAAVVAGASALLLQKHPTWTPDQVKAALRNTARPLLGVATPAQGKGVVNVLAALSNVPGAATQQFTRSTGNGSLEAARGTAHLVADDGTTLQGEIDLLGAPWLPAVWAPASTAGTAWQDGSWNGNVWAGPGWATGDTDGAAAWAARSWRCATWSARSWRADLWAARSWRTDQWAARTWRGDSWG